jgi:hypothetical protein
MRPNFSVRSSLLLALLPAGISHLSAAAARGQILAPNLIYTSLQPCRVFDTRSATNGTNGRLIHGMAQTFNVVGGNVTATTFTGQGGHDGGCAIPGFDSFNKPQAQAVVLNFVAVGAAGSGDLVGWPSDHAQPNASLLNYANAAALGFLNIANGIVVPVRQDAQGADLTLLAQVSDTDVVADAVGYFSQDSAVQGAGVQNLFTGAGAGNPGAATGSSNTAFGHASLAANTTGHDNTALGRTALLQSTTASNNTAVGSGALFSATTGGDNTAIGENSLVRSTTAVMNTAAGSGALFSNTTGSLNTAVGAGALGNNTTASDNTAVGWATLASNTTGSENTGIGLGALNHNLTGSNNTAVGQEALNDLSAADDNTAVGQRALVTTTGGSNTAVGRNALSANVTGSGNIAVGAAAGQSITAGSNNIDIGNSAPGDESAAIRIGTAGTQTAAFIAGISGATSSGGVAVFVNAGGQLGTATSSLRFKEEVEEIGAASGGLMRLRPVTFRYKPSYDDGSNLLQYGLIAEEVAKVYPDLVQYDRDGRPLAVRYHFVNAMLLNEVQLQHRDIAAQRAEIAAQRAEIAAQRNAIEALSHGAAKADALAGEVQALEAALARLAARLEARKAP